MFAFNRSDIHHLEGSAAELTLRQRVENQLAWDSRGTNTDNIVPPRWNVDIETLSDDVLLEIFDLCLDEDEDMSPRYDMGIEEDERYAYDGWYTLVHVCQRWRYVVFESPRRLNLRLHCSRRRVREMLGVWPAFPIVIWDTEDFTSDEENIIAALEHRDRVQEIKLGHFTRSQSEKLVPVMQESFPALTKLQIESYSRRIVKPLPVLPDSFLGGSAPHLRFLYLASISFPALPNVLLSASNLLYLYLHGIPPGYISPEMVAALSALTKLENMRLVFHYPNSDSDLKDRAPPPLTRSVLPALRRLELRGGGEYLDDFVARIDVPLINYLEIGFTNRHFFVDDFFHLPQFIGGVEKFRSTGYACFDLSPNSIRVTLSPSRWTPGTLQLNFLCDTGGPLPSLVEAFNTILPPLSDIESFHVSVPLIYQNLPIESEFTEDPQWLEVLRRFASAKSLSLGSMDFVQPVAFALKRVIEEGMTDVLPAIQELTLPELLSAGPDREAIEQFATARGLSVLETSGSSTWQISARDTHEG